MDSHVAPALLRPLPHGPAQERSRWCHPRYRGRVGEFRAPCRFHGSGADGRSRHSTGWHKSAACSKMLPADDIRRRGVTRLTMTGWPSATAANRRPEPGSGRGLQIRTHQSPNPRCRCASALAKGLRRSAPDRRRKPSRGSRAGHLLLRLPRRTHRRSDVGRHRRYGRAHHRSAESASRRHPRARAPPHHRRSPPAVYAGDLRLQHSVDPQRRTGAPLNSEAPDPRRGTPRGGLGESRSTTSPAKGNCVRTWTSTSPRCSSWAPSTGLSNGGILGVAPSRPWWPTRKHTSGTAWPSNP